MNKKNIDGDFFPVHFLFRQNIIRVVFIAIAYFFAHQLSFFFPDSQKVLMAIWPAGGIGLAALLLNPRRLWPSILIVLFIAGNSANFIVGRPWIGSIGFMTANILESLGCAILISGGSKNVVRFTRVQEVFFLILAAGLVNACTSFIGAGTAFFISSEPFWNFWFSWWISDGLGILLITPLIITWADYKNPIVRITWKRVSVFGIFLVLWCAIAWLMFRADFISHFFILSPYMLLALLTLPALQFGLRGVTIALIVLAIIAFTSTAVSIGPSPWGGENLVERLLLSQIYLGITTITGMLLAASFTETKYAERSSRINKERLSAIADNIPNGMVYQVIREHSGSKHFLYVSAGVQRLNGVSAEEVLRNPSVLYNLIVEEDRIMLEIAEEASARDMSLFNMIVRFSLPDGQNRWMLLSSLPRRLEDGRIVWDGIQMDITERKNLENQLKEALDWYEEIFEGSRDAVFISDIESRFILVNKAAEQLTGFSRNELLKMRIPDLHDNPDQKAYLEFHDRIISGEEITSEAKILRKDGSKVSTEFNNKTILINGRKFMHTTARDITERKKAEESLRQSEEQFRILSEQSPNMIFINQKGKIVYTNKKCEEMMGYTHEEFSSLTFSFLSLIAPEHRERVKMYFNKHLMGQELGFNEYALMTKDGKNIEAIVSTKLIHFNGDTAILGIVTDVTEQKKVQAEHLRLQNLESLGVLAGGIAHDFNNLLAVILGNLSLAIEDTQDERVRKELLAIDKATRMAAALSKQLLTFAKGGAPEKLIINVKKLIQETTKFALSGSNVEPTFDFNNSLSLQADPGQISQVIQNIIINAKEAMPNGGTINISTEDYTDNDNKKHVKICIRDQGIGIPKDQIHKIMDPYFSTKSRGSEKGSGLGLSVCYSIIKRHEGKIFVESEVNVGTTLTIILPAKDGVLMIEKQEGDKNCKVLNILIMDDEQEVRETLQNLLSRLGHRVTESKNGQEAIDIYKSNKIKGEIFDLVFLDLTVRGGMGGKETVKKLREIEPGLKAIVSSGYADAYMKANEDGFDAKLNKPYARKELNRAISDVMGK